MQLSDISLGLVGAGKMGGAMLSGWLDQGVKGENVQVIDPKPSQEIKILAKEKGFMLSAFPEGLFAPDLVVIAVKPQMMKDVLPSLGAFVGPKSTILSIAAGIPVSTYQSYFGAARPVVRAMPNTPAQVGCGMVAAYASGDVPYPLKVIVAELMKAVGAFTWVEDEGLIDAVTAVSGSGPAYVFYLVEALAKAGEQVGLDPQNAALMARQTIVGAGALLEQSNLDASQLRRNVTSPGGTTAAALDVLMDKEKGLEGLMEKVVLAARDRSIALSKPD